MSCTEIQHRVLSLGSIHGAVNWYAETTAEYDSVVRDATYTQTDLYKLVYIAETKGLMMLVGLSPNAWIGVGGNDVALIVVSGPTENSSGAITLTLQDGTQVSGSLSAYTLALRTMWQQDDATLNTALREWVAEQLQLLNTALTEQLEIQAEALSELADRVTELEGKPPRSMVANMTVSPDFLNETLVCDTPGEKILQLDNLADLKPGFKLTFLINSTDPTSTIKVVGNADNILHATGGFDTIKGEYHWGALFLVSGDEDSPDPYVWALTGGS